MPLLDSSSEQSPRENLSSWYEMGSWTFYFLNFDINFRSMTLMYWMRLESSQLMMEHALLFDVTLINLLKILLLNIFTLTWQLLYLLKLLSQACPSPTLKLSSRPNINCVTLKTRVDLHRQWPNQPCQNCNYTGWQKFME